MIVSQEAAASRVGLDILKRGGNAVDAAVAVGFALAVTLPRAGNLGGGGFMLIYRADLKRTIAIDYRETAPAATTKDVFLDANGKADPFKSRYSGLGDRRAGNRRRPRACLAQIWLWEIFLRRSDRARRSRSRGKVLPSTTTSPIPCRWPRRRLPAILRRRASICAPTAASRRPAITSRSTISPQRSRRSPPTALAGFYSGPVAQKIVEAVNAAGGRMTIEDLANYRAVEREPVRGTYRGYTVVSMPPPSSGGAHIIEILNILEGFPLAAQGLNSAASLHEMAEAEKLAYADRAAWLGDPDFVKIPLAGLISKPYAEHLRSLIAPDRARPAADIRPGEPQRYESDQTTHFSIVDERRQCGRQHLHAQSSLWVRLGCGRDRGVAQQRARRLRRQARRRQCLRAHGRRRQCAGADEAAAVVDESDACVQGRQAPDGDRQSRRLHDHLDRAADHPQCDRSRPERRGSGERAARA